MAGMAVTLPVAAMMFWANYTAFSNKAAFDAWEAEQGHHGPVVRVEHRVEHRAPQPVHDPNAYYPSEHQAPDAEANLQVWAAVVAGGAGLAVLAMGMAAFSLLGGGNKGEEEVGGSEGRDNPFV